MYDPEARRSRHWFRIGVFALLAAFVVGVLTFLFLVAYRATPAGTPPYYPFGYGFFGFFGFFLVLFLVFGVMRWIFFPWRWAYRRGYGYYGHGDSAAYILRERYARGVITKEQYDAMMRDLYPQQRQGP